MDNSTPDFDPCVAAPTARSISMNANGLCVGQSTSFTVSVGGDSDYAGSDYEIDFEPADCMSPSPCPVSFENNATQATTGQVLATKAASPCVATFKVTVDGVTTEQSLDINIAGTADECEDAWEILKLAPVAQSISPNTTSMHVGDTVHFSAVVFGDSDYPGARYDITITPPDCLDTPNVSFANGSSTTQTNDVLAFVPTNNCSVTFNVNAAGVTTQVSTQLTILS